jgi:TRAP-type C4-dicarboxylate transport system permease large subunit
MWDLGGVFISVPRLIAFVFAVALTVLLYFVIQKTEVGRAIRATSQNRFVAQLMGIPYKHVYALVFGLGLGLLGMSGGLMVPFFPITPIIGATFGFKAMVIVVLGGIYTGLTTPTEAAGFACLVAFILGMFVYKELTWKKIPGILVKTVRTLGTCSAIFAIASCFSYAITFENIPAKIAAFLLSLTSNKYVMLLLVNMMLLIIGCFMEGLSAVMIVTPMLLPALKQLGVDPVQVGLIFAVNTTLGLLTPPFGLSLFMASSVAELPVLRIAKRSMPQFLVLLGCLLLFTFVPQISTWLPQMMLG